MSNTTIALRSSGATGNVPTALSLAYGEFALNYADGIIYYRTDSDTIGSILNAQPSGLDKEIQFNDLGSFGSSANLSFNKSTGLLSTSRIYVSANAQIVGNVTASKLISNNSIGDSGGELLLAKSVTNTTLAGLGITIDAFQNKIRFFEQGGTNRGAYIDLSEAAANVGTNLLATGGGGGGGANAVLQYRSSYTANSGQTVFAATYSPGYVDTFLNGVYLTPGVDFTATNGTSITLSDPAVSNDSVEIIGYNSIPATVDQADQLTTGHTIGMTGDVTWTSASFNGTTDVTGTSTLANTGVTTGTYTKVTVDAKGRVTSGNTLSSTDLPTYTGNISNSQVTTALGYTPYNSANLSIDLTPYLLITTAANTYAASNTSVPAGGSTGNILVKASGADYNTAWSGLKTINSISLLGTGDITITSGGGGGGGTEYTANTTDATLTTIATIPAKANTMALVIADIVTRRTDAGATDVAAWRIRSVARRDTGNAIDVGQVYEEVIARTNASLFVDIESSSTNVTVKVQGIAGQNYSWKAVVQLIEI